MSGDVDGGAEGIRTLDPHVANVVLSQLSYCPIAGARIVLRRPRRGKGVTPRPGERGSPAPPRSGPPAARLGLGRSRRSALPGVLGGRRRPVRRCAPPGGR